MIPNRFQTVTARYRDLRVALVGDFCLDRYLEIDPSLNEISIETGLPVYNVTRVRSQPGGAGTILNNLVALGISTIYPIGFYGHDGEGYELREAISSLPGVLAKHFLQTTERQTFTYTKPLIVTPNCPPQELNRLDRKNWSRTPATLIKKLGTAVSGIAANVDAIILLDQVDRPDTGVITQGLLQVIQEIGLTHPHLFILADSRRGLTGFPSVVWKMNQSELAALTETAARQTVADIVTTTARLAGAHGRHVFVTLAENGIVGASPDGEVAHVPALPLRGPIDIVGAGDAVTANLTTAMAAGATLRESLEIAAAAASVVIHQLGTTGTASLTQIGALVNSETVHE